jgi:hypothetical protein
MRWIQTMPRLYGRRVKNWLESPFRQALTACLWANLIPGRKRVSLSKAATHRVRKAGLRRYLSLRILTQGRSAGCDQFATARQLFPPANNYGCCP